MPNTFSVTQNLGEHWVNVGFDNNAAIKTKIFKNIGGYKWWLGPGCLVPYGEDAEFILRSLIAGYKIAYNPKMLVYHNRFLTEKEFAQQTETYTYGGLVTYGFYAIQGVKDLEDIFLNHIKYFFYGAKSELKNKNIKNCFNKLRFLVKGLFFAFLFAKLVPMPEKENVVKRFYKKRK
jgi:GT2 family glycosyltransferase